jgi:hypothetical protein
MDGESIATLVLISALAVMNFLMLVISWLTYLKTVVARQSNRTVRSVLRLCSRVVLRSIAWRLRLSLRGFAGGYRISSREQSGYAYCCPYYAVRIRHDSKTNSSIGARVAAATAIATTVAATANGTATGTDNVRYSV